MKILFIACYSPLINNSASIETLQYLNNLANIGGNQVHLLTVNFPKNSIYYDENILSMLDKKVKIHIISGGKFFERIMPKKVTSNTDEVSYNKQGIKNLLKSVKKVMAVPDMYLYWAIKASKYGKILMKKEKFDVMFSMHEPPSSHICAYRIKKKFIDLKWVTYWSDPWLKDSTRDSSGVLRRKIEGILEKKIISLADKFVFVTEDNRRDYIKSYNIPVEKTFKITRGYDEKTYEEISKEKIPPLIDCNKINLIYAGEVFSKLRDITPFIAALERIQKSNEDLYKRLNVLFFGNIDNKTIKENLMKISIAKVSDRVPYREALRYMINGDILILFGNKNSKQIPAKIYDYFGCYGYILVILGDEKDPIISVVENKEKCSVVVNNEIDIEKAIMELSEKVTLGGKANPVKEYEWKQISRILNNILEE